MLDNGEIVERVPDSYLNQNEPSQLVKEPEKQRNLNSISDDEDFDETVSVLNNLGLIDETMYEELKKIATEAYTIKDGSPHPDYSSRLKAIDMYNKLKKKYSNQPVVQILNHFSSNNQVY